MPLDVYDKMDCWDAYFSLNRRKGLVLMEKDVLKILSSSGNKTAANNLIFVCLQILFKAWKNTPSL